MNDYVSLYPAARAWFMEASAQLETDWYAGCVERADYWQRFNAIQAEYSRLCAEAHTAYELWWVEQDVPECKRREQAHVRARLVARGLVTEGGQQLALFVE